MSVPTDNLYDFIHQVTEKRYWLMRSYPWGSRELADFGDYQSDLDGPNGIPVEKRVLHQLMPELQKKLPYFKQVRNLQPVLFCHDQEPLNFALYQDDSDVMQRFFQTLGHDSSFPHADFNLRNAITWSWQQSWTLLHSELNSPELAKYENTGKYVGAYWWSHGMIARDWYRYAEYDRSLNHGDFKKMFLVYARDFGGTRKYRQDFVDQIADISTHCQIGSVGQEAVTSDSSARYSSNDFNHTAISVVLETLFDDPRIHLTEKTLRPIACGHPFILAAGPGSLALLRSYGFETFSPWINESYDDIQDSKERLQAIIAEMKRLSSLLPEQQAWVIGACRDVAVRNKKRFFHSDFHNHLVDELTTNVSLAWKRHQGRLSPDFWFQTLLWRRKNKPEYFTPEIKSDLRLLLRLAKKLRQST